MTSHALSIAELGDLIQSTLENELSPTYWVIGEIADFRQAPQGHAYFELAEKQGSQVRAKIRCNCWQFTYRAIASRFESFTGSSIKNGMKVLAQVQVTFHPVYGLSLNVKDIDASFSLGERARIRQENIDRLTREGLLRLNASRTFPPVIQKIAIISSATAAGYGDFINHIDHNAFGYKVYHNLFPSLMQGNGAVASLIQALDLVENTKDELGLEAIVIIRGGGAQLDLDCFDSYELAAKIAQSSLPVFTGIGHERDETIADLVAHSRLKTPTAVADFLISGFRIFEENLGNLLSRLDRQTRQQLKLAAASLDQSKHQIRGLVQNRINLEQERIRSRKHQLVSSLLADLQHKKVSLDKLSHEVEKGAIRFISDQKKNLDQVEKSIRQLDPISLLSKGYSRSEIEGVPVDIAKVKVGQIMVTHTSSKQIKSIIEDIEEK